MDPAVERVLHHQPDEHADAAVRVADLTDETQLWELMTHYNWDDGFAVPLAVVHHPRCDRGLALRLYWELDDAAQIHHSDEQHALRETYDVEARYQPDDFAALVAYCTTLVQGLRDETFPIGRNSFDTGFFGLEDPELTERQRSRKALATSVAERDYEEGFLRPVTGSG